MSYEGFTQVLCKKGHLREFDAFDFVELHSDEDKCSCGEQFVFSHQVNETNGIIKGDESTNRFPFIINTPEEWLQCDMGHKHVITEVTYQIPETE